MRLLWSQTVSAPLRGLALARERGWLLGWDTHHWLYLFNQAGERQAQRGAPAALAAACAADDGGSYAAVGQQGQVWLLAPDLALRWERSVPQRALAVAMDPFGQYLAVAAANGGLYLFDNHGGMVAQASTPRPMQHLAFVPEKPVLIASADFGLAACFDLAGKCLWRDGLVAHIGSIATSGDGQTIALACFSEGVCVYSLEKPTQRKLPQAAPCRLAALTYTGDGILTAGLDRRLHLGDRDGAVRDSFAPDGSPVGLVFGALGLFAAVALAEGKILGLDTRQEVR
jgi:hypothetical protein